MKVCHASSKKQQNKRALEVTYLRNGSMPKFCEDENLSFIYMYFLTG